MSSSKKEPRKATELLGRNVGRAPSTCEQDKPAIKLFNYFLMEILSLDPIDEMDRTQLSDELEDILTGYSLYLCNTLIPKNHVKYLADKSNSTPSEYMKYTGLTEYLSKAIQLLKKVVPGSELWDDKEALEDISGAKFKRACKRSQ